MSYAVHKPERDGVYQVSGSPWPGGAIRYARFVLGQWSQPRLTIDDAENAPYRVGAPLHWRGLAAQQVAHIDQLPLLTDPVVPA